MLSQRVVQQSMRRLAVNHPARTSAVLSRFSTPAAIATSNGCLQKRFTATQESVSQDTAYTILEKQRLKRPVSPHLGIYRPQITWIPSILNRITGSVLSGGLYIFGAAYLVSPLFGWHLESATLAAAFGALPLAAKFGLKTLVAWPFTFHSFNGLRHLVWDMGLSLTNKKVAQTGWFVVGLSTVTAFALALL
ncbi:MAG: hypothetical protein M1820_001584 [Bogoriella megaspora]|nr:MAG: hypothetical protein M1820_001584 [Bogoriella megaspora]